MLKTWMGSALLLMASMSVNATNNYDREGYSLHLSPGTGTFVGDKIEVQFGGQYNLTTHAFDFQERNESLGAFSLILKPGYEVKTITAGIKGSYEINGIETDGLYSSNAFFSTGLVAYRTNNPEFEIPNNFYALGAWFDNTIFGEAGYPQMINGPFDNQQQLGYWGDLGLFRAFTGELQLSALTATFPITNSLAYSSINIESVYLSFEVIPSVPEPEMLGMLLAGLGLLGFSARRRAGMA